MKVLKEHIRHPDRSFRYLRLELDAFDLAQHRHPHWELTWIERGQGVRFVGDNASAFGAGDLVLLGSELPHTWKSVVRRDGTSLATVLQFPAELLDTPVMPELVALKPMRVLAQRGICIVGDTHNRVTRCLSRMEELDALGRALGLLEILRWISLAPADSRPIATRPMVPGDCAGRDGRADRVVQWIHAHSARALALDEAARVAAISEAAFSRFFRREMGKTFSDFVNDVRVAQACVRLADSTLPIATVAGDCGFPTLSHFNRQFRARLGVTPRQYRKPGRPPTHSSNQQAG
jgi:AraC-like DNA-binding protein